MAKKRAETPATKIGRQLPTTSHTLPYQNTIGPEAVALYNTEGRQAFPWQAHLLDDMLAYDDDGLWIHSRFGLSIPRRNGKNEVLVILELWAIKNGYRLLHTAHRNTTAHSAWERLYEAMNRSGVIVTSAYRALGRETLESDAGGRVEFRTRTAKGGLGEGFDILVVDEAQEYQDDQESALKYVVTDSENPLTIYLGTPPTPQSSGTVFPKFRAAVLAGKAANAGWAEWGVDQETDPNDRAAWYEANPSLGLKLTERAVADEVTGDIVDFNIQRLGMWYSVNLKSAITAVAWAALKVKQLPELKGRLYVGIKYGHDGENVSLSIAVKTTTPRQIFVEGYDCRPIRAGTGWIVQFLTATAGAVKQVVIDGPAYQGMLVNDLKAERVKCKVIVPTVAQVISANAAFEQAVEGQTLAHNGQPSLEQAAVNCEKRMIGQHGGFGYQSTIPGVDVSLLDSVILAHWAAQSDKSSAHRQTIRY